MEVGLKIGSRWQRHLLLALVTGFALRLFFIRYFRFEAGDTRIYEELARNWLDHSVYGLFIDGRLVPVDIRAPGYPAFLAIIYAALGRSRIAVMFVQSLVDLVSCALIGLLATRIAPESGRCRAAIAAVWLAALCPFTANYTAVPLTEVLALFFTVIALLSLINGCMGRERLTVFLGRHAYILNAWFLGGILVGLGTLVRPEGPLILASVALVLVVRWRRRADWRKLLSVGLLTGAGLMLPLAPWAARNAYSMHRWQFLAPRYAEMPGEFVPRGFLHWTQTWLVKFQDVYLVPWKLEEEPIPIETIPYSAFDSDEERSRVAQLLTRYNEDLTVSPELDHEFEDLARERSRRHPIRTYLMVPISRIATLWMTPRLELLPFSGALWPPLARWKEDPIDFSVAVGFGLLNFVYLTMAIAGGWRSRGNRGLIFLLCFILVRTLFLTGVETPEPRYVLVCFPVILAFAALLWARPPERGSSSIANLVQEE